MTTTGLVDESAREGGFVESTSTDSPQSVAGTVFNSHFEEHRIRGGLMIYSHTQISQYLDCPRRHRYRYLDEDHRHQPRQ